LSAPIILAVVGLTVLSGTALVWVVRAERRRATIALRLKAIAAGPPRAEPPVVSLLRPPPQRRALPAVLCAKLDASLAATGDRIGLPHLAVVGIIAAVLAGSASAATVFRPPLAIIAAGVSMVGVPALLLRRAQSRYQRQFLDVFPDALDLIVRAVRAGLPAPEAIEAATREVRPPVSIEFQRMLDEMRIGVEMEVALQHAADRVRVPDFEFFVVSLLLQRQTGGGIAETLSNLSTIIRQRKAARQKARALTSEATASAVVVAAMPFVAGVGLFLINHQLMSILLTDRRGRFMLGLAVISLLLGMAVMKTVIKKSLR
jgi:tight adherence protein B